MTSDEPDGWFAARVCVVAHLVGQSLAARTQTHLARSGPVMTQRYTMSIPGTGDTWDVLDALESHQRPRRPDNNRMTTGPRTFARDPICFSSSDCL